MAIRSYSGAQGRSKTFLPPHHTKLFLMTCPIPYNHKSRNPSFLHKRPTDSANHFCEWSHAEDAHRILLYFLSPLRLLIFFHVENYFVLHLRLQFSELFIRLPVWDTSLPSIGKVRTASFLASEKCSHLRTGTCIRASHSSHHTS